MSLYGISLIWYASIKAVAKGVRIVEVPQFYYQTPYQGVYMYNVAKGVQIIEVPLYYCNYQTPYQGVYNVACIYVHAFQGLLIVDVILLVSGVLSAIRMSPDDSKIPGYPWLLLCRFGVGFGAGGTAQA